MRTEPQLPIDAAAGAGKRSAIEVGAIGRTRTRRSAWRKLLDLAAIAFAFFSGAALVGGYATYRIWEVGRRDDRRPVDAIVVLGAAQYDGRPSPVLAARLEHAVSLYKSGLAPWFVVTGGKQPGDRVTEAESEREYAITHGVPVSAILSESEGRTTLESMEGVRALFAAHGLRTGLFVSDRTHMLRVLRMASDQGIEAYGSPTATSPTDTDPVAHWDSVQHELGALALYLLADRPTSTKPLPATSPAKATAPTATPSVPPAPAPSTPPAASAGAGRDPALGRLDDDAAAEASSGGSTADNASRDGKHGDDSRFGRTHVKHDRGAHSQHGIADGGQPGDHSGGDSGDARGATAESGAPTQEAD